MVQNTRLLYHDVFFKSDNETAQNFNSWENTRARPHVGFASCDYAPTANGISQGRKIICPVSLNTATCTPLND